MISEEQLAEWELRINAMLKYMAHAEQDATESPYPDMQKMIQEIRRQREVIEKKDELLKVLADDERWESCSGEDYFIQYSYIKLNRTDSGPQALAREALALTDEKELGEQKEG